MTHPGLLHILLRARSSEPSFSGLHSALVLSGCYEEAGDSGRHRVQAGNVVLHDAFEAHLDRIPTSGAVVLNVPLSAQYAFQSGVGRAEDPDAIVRLAGNFPMALDEASHRVFVATRSPARLVVFDADLGHVVTTLPAVQDADDLYFDAERKRIYIPGGEGHISVFRQRDAPLRPPSEDSNGF
jgi:hypothetical protein